MLELKGKKVIDVRRTTEDRERTRKDYNQYLVIASITRLRQMCRLFVKEDTTIYVRVVLISSSLKLQIYGSHYRQPLLPISTNKSLFRSLKPLQILCKYIDTLL